MIRPARNSNSRPIWCWSAPSPSTRCICCWSPASARLTTRLHTGTVGRNYAYQCTSGATVHLPGKTLNPFIAGGAVGMAVYDYNGDNFDHTGLGFIGGGLLQACQTGGRPLTQLSAFPGDPKWGGGWKQAVKENYQSTYGLGAQGSRQSYRDAYLDLDPTYKDPYGSPLLRMTFDWHDNERKMSAFLTGKLAEIGNAMGADRVVQHPRTGPYSVVPYQTRTIPAVRSPVTIPQPALSTNTCRAGRAERVRLRRQRVPAECRLQSDRDDRGAGLLGRERHQEPVSEKSRPAGVGVRSVTMQISMFRTAFAAGVFVAASVSLGATAEADPATAASMTPAQQQAQTIAEGHYLAIAGDCAACHTDPGGAPYAGGVAIHTPFGSLVGSNLTPDKATGIGSWTDDQFVNAVKEGIGHDGERLFPGMPYTDFNKVSRTDILKIRAYLATLPPVHNEINSDQLHFPFNVRAGMIGWDLMFFANTGTFKPVPTELPEWNRGAYLVQGLEHCATCHTDKNALGADDSGTGMQGYVVDGWNAPALTDDASGIGSWSVQDIATYLKTGHNAYADATTAPCLRRFRFRRRI